MEKRILIRRWLGPDAQAIPIYDEASVSSARQRVREAGQRAGVSNQIIETVALIASELTHNHLAHAKQGYFSVAPVDRNGIKGLQVVAADLGPGIDKPGTVIRDRPATADGSLGAGLAGVCRLADEVEFDNRLSEGVFIVARKFENAADAICEVAIMSKPYPGEPMSGDDAAVIRTEDGFLAAVADGLGHGLEAREASNRAMEITSRIMQTGLDQIAINLNTELSGTRGCAMSLMRFNRKDATLEYVSAGDVHAHVYHLRDAYFFTPTPLVLGTGPIRPQRIRVERTSVKPNSVLVIFTDGLKSKTTLKGELDMLRQPTIAIAEHLLESHSRPDDDALVCVIRLAR
ncbi:MAG TPA: SpoIIE family protein phosphatase [Terriglobia bacterium]|nr:SpoIIE family protein phosphatase [Terriglobia bacterium]